MKKLVSILIPVYNRENLVGESIESALKQSYENIEVIIVDNYSTDKTWNVLEHYAAKDSRIKIFQNSENVGPVLNWQRCIEEAKGEYAKILFSDDLISENFVAETIGLFDEDTAFVLSSISIFNEAQEQTETKYFKNKVFSKNLFLLSSLLFNYYYFPISPGCALFRLTDLSESLIVDLPNDISLDFKKYGAGNDLLLYLNTAIKYKYIKSTDTAVAYFRDHNESFSISNNLYIYYKYAKYYFIKTRMKWLLPLFKLKYFFSLK